MNDAYVTRHEFQAFREEMREFRAEMRAEFHEMRADMRDIRGEVSRLKYWMLSTLLAVVVALIAEPRI